MGIKGWFEKKIEERKAKKDQENALKRIHKPIKEISKGRHDASKKDYVHKHGDGFLSKFFFTKDDGTKIVMYKHRPGYNHHIPTNNQRVVAGRKKKDPNYNPIRKNKSEPIEVVI